MGHGIDNDLAQLTQFLKQITMKYYVQLELLLINCSFNRAPKEALLQWLRTTAQSAIDRQHNKVKKLIVKNLTDSPPIFLS